MSINIPNSGSPNAVPPGRDSPLILREGETRRLSFADTAKLEIRPDFSSDLATYRGSRLVAERIGGSYDVTRVRDVRPEPGVEIALSRHEMLALLIHAASMTSARPEFVDSTFAVRQPSPNEYRVTRILRGT